MFRLQQQVKETRIRKETGQPVPKIGHIRVQKDVNELDIPPSFDVRFPDPNDLMHFELTISPEEGYYNNGAFDFTIQVPEDYPHKPPKVKCTTLIYHPNIDLQGNVCLNILRQDWKPVLSLSSVLYGLQLLFLEPNPDDPLNKDAANLLKRDRHEFQKNVTNSIRGGYVAVSLMVERDVSWTNLYSIVLDPEYVFTENCWEQVYKGLAEDYSHMRIDFQSQRR